MAPAEGGATLQTNTHKLDEKGLHTVNKSGESLTYWEAIVSVEETENLILVFIDTLQAYIFPKGQLSSEQQILEYIKEQTKNITK